MGSLGSIWTFLVNSQLSVTHPPHILFLTAGVDERVAIFRVEEESLAALEFHRLFDMRGVPFYDLVCSAIALKSIKGRSVAVTGGE